MLGFSIYGRLCDQTEKQAAAKLGQNQTGHFFYIGNLGNYSVGDDQCINAFLFSLQKNDIPDSIMLGLKGLACFAEVFIVLYVCICATKIWKHCLPLYLGAVYQRTLTSESNIAPKIKICFSLTCFFGYFFVASSF